jgi:hypothetical protein
MATKSRRDEYTFVSLRADSYDAAVEAAVNVNLRTTVPRYVEDGDSVFTGDMRLDVVATSIDPSHRADEKYEITAYRDRSERTQLKFKDIHARDAHEVPVYRSYRGQQFPVYNRPPGLAVIHKTHGRREWRLAVWVLPSVTSDMLALLRGSRPLYISIHERKADRQRWVQALSLQTKNPAEE